MTIQNTKLKNFLVQSKALGSFKDLHEFATRRQAKAYIRNLVRDWGEHPADFRIIKIKRFQRR